MSERRPSARGPDGSAVGRVGEHGAASRRPYEPPRLEPLGDVRTLVLGGSPGIGDSATNPHIYRP